MSGEVPFQAPDRTVSTAASSSGTSSTRGNTARDAWTPSRAGGIVRIARRPPGWQPPGPAPAGPGQNPALWPGAGEDLCYLLGDWRIFQRTTGHRWSLDDLVTAWFACAQIDRAQVSCAQVSCAIDLGCGIGSVLMMMAWRLPETRFIGVEAQEVSAALARRSLEYNGAAGRCEVRLGDFRETSMVQEGARFDLVTGTPPYFEIGRGHISEKVQCGPCRFEHRGGIEAYCGAASRLLAPGGTFVVCESAGQIERVARAASDSSLMIRAQLDVVPRAGKAPLVSVFSMARAESGPGEATRAGSVTSHETLVVRDTRGQWTEAFLQVRRDMGMPPSPRGTGTDIA